MLTNSFLMLDRIGQKSEQKLWKNDILTWNDFLQTDNAPGIGKTTKQKHDQFLTKAQKNLQKQNRTFFKHNIPSSATWRLAREFNNATAYIDIETTGLDRKRNSITTISIHDGQKTRTLIKGQNLTQQTLQNELNKHSLLVSFNGARFDLPFIQQKFPNIQLDHPHIDLMYPCKKLGLSGGLKNIEKQLEITRGDVDGVDGREAVRLWKQYQKGDQKALQKLIKYNQKDVTNLKQLLNIVYKRLKTQQFNSIIG